jgi:hypothetical protein
MPDPSWFALKPPQASMAIFDVGAGNPHLVGRVRVGVGSGVMEQVLTPTPVDRPALARISQTGEVHRGSESEKVVLQQTLSSDAGEAPMQTDCITDLFGFAPR